MKKDPRFGGRVLAPDVPGILPAGCGKNVQCLRAAGAKESAHLSAKLRFQSLAKPCRRALRAGPVPTLVADGTAGPSGKDDPLATLTTTHLRHFLCG
jgi:hypothetical protein